jgi:hypothetical protein
VQVIGAGSNFAKRHVESDFGTFCVFNDKSKY